MTRVKRHLFIKRCATGRLRRMPGMSLGLDLGDEDDVGLVREQRPTLHVILGRPNNDIVTVLRQPARNVDELYQVPADCRDEEGRHLFRDSGDPMRAEPARHRRELRQLRGDQPECEGAESEEPEEADEVEHRGERGLRALDERGVGEVELLRPGACRLLLRLRGALVRCRARVPTRGPLRGPARRPPVPMRCFVRYEA